MTGSSRWTDLRPRVLSAIVMVAAGAAAIWAGGVWFQALVAAVAGGMIWELAVMLGAGRQSQAVVLAVLGAVVVWIGGGLTAPVSWGMVWGLALLVGAAVGALARRDRVIGLIYGFVIAAACITLIAFRDMSGAMAVVWLVAVIAASDIMGYFAGRSLGGPKFWPKVSPKKTWSGTVAGWLGAAVVGWLFTGSLEDAAISVGIAFAGQMGDIAESAIKRRAGVKDASNLIPGHGGLLDRFDALIGAGLVVFVVLSLVQINLAAP